jgi:hypothetical protein
VRLGFAQRRLESRGINSRSQIVFVYADDPRHSSLLILVLWPATDHTERHISDVAPSATGAGSDLAAAQRTYVDALHDELRRRDLLEAETEVRTGEKPPQLEMPLPVAKDTQQALQNLRLLGLQIDASRLAYGVVDRFSASTSSTSTTSPPSPRG